MPYANNANPQYFSAPLISPGCRLRKPSTATLPQPAIGGFMGGKGSVLAAERSSSFLPEFDRSNVRRTHRGAMAYRVTIRYFRETTDAQIATEIGDRSGDHIADLRSHSGELAGQGRTVVVTDFEGRAGPLAATVAADGENIILINIT
jgi:hypothetical protein